jgi:hypothetical protein
MFPPLWRTNLLAPFKISRKIMSDFEHYLKNGPWCVKLVFMELFLGSFHFFDLCGISIFGLSQILFIYLFK